MHFAQTDFPFLSQKDKNFLAGVVTETPVNLPAAIITATVLNTVLESRQEDIKKTLVLPTNHSRILDWLEVNAPEIYKDMMSLNAILVDVYSAYKLSVESPLKSLTEIGFKHLGVVDLTEFIEGAEYIGAPFTTEQASNVVSKILRRMYARLVEKYGIDTFCNTQYELRSVYDIYTAAVEKYTPEYGATVEQVILDLEDRLFNPQSGAEPEVEVEFDDDLPALDEEVEIEERIPNRPAAQ
jgi:hypothetical protein